MAKVKTGLFSFAGSYVQVRLLGAFPPQTQTIPRSSLVARPGNGHSPGSLAAPGALYATWSEGTANRR